MKTIPLTQGKSALVDDEDYEWLSQYNWYAKKQVQQKRTVWYAVRNSPRIVGNRSQLKMHREILGLGNSKTQADHQNGNTLDNQRTNLRVATVARNQQNRQKRVKCSSRFKGVSWHKKTSKWTVRITPPDSQKQISLGYYDDEEVAAGVYN